MVPPMRRPRAGVGSTWYDRSASASGSFPLRSLGARFGADYTGRAPLSIPHLGQSCKSRSSPILLSVALKRSGNAPGLHALRLPCRFLDGPDVRASSTTVVSANSVRRVAVVGVDEHVGHRGSLGGSKTVAQEHVGPHRRVSGWSDASTMRMIGADRSGRSRSSSAFTAREFPTRA